MPLKLTTATRKDVNTGLQPLQHRHFATIAMIIREMPRESERNAAARHFADKLQQTNPKFDRTRFLCACIATEV